MDIRRHLVHIFASAHCLLQWRCCLRCRLLGEIIGMVVADRPKRWLVELVGRFLVEMGEALFYPYCSCSDLVRFLDALPPSPVGAWSGAELGELASPIGDQGTVGNDRDVAGGEEERPPKGCELGCGCRLLPVHLA